MNRASTLALWVIGAFAALILLAQLWFAGTILLYRYVDPGDTAFMRQRLALMRETNPRATLRHQWVDYENISDNLKRALIASEDAKFVDHEGFDWEGIQAAFEKNRESGKFSAGGSTITQQLAKNLFLSPNKSYLRKGQEAIITALLEALLTKERIFELYLNVIEWGEGVFGAHAAAERYFKQSPAKLTAAQAARLAAMAPNPRYYEKNPQARGLARKANIILQRMGAAELPQ